MRASPLHPSTYYVNPCVNPIIMNPIKGDQIKIHFVTYNTFTVSVQSTENKNSVTLSVKMSVHSIN